jgi:hypothetical protein
VGLGEGEVDEEVGLGFGQQLRNGREARGQAVGDPPELLGGRVFVGLLEDAPDRGGDHARGAPGHERLGIPGEVDPAALPCSTEERRPDGRDEAPVGVADDEPDAGQATLDEPAQERPPGVSLVVAGGELEPEDPAFPGGRHPDRDEGGHADDKTTVADLDVRGIEKQVRIALVGERAAPEGGDLGIEGGADPAHLAPGEVRDPERFDEVLHPAGADAGHVRLLDDREEGPLGPPSWLEQAREVRAVVDLGDREPDRADAGVPAALAIPVPVRQPAVRGTLAFGGAGELGDLGLHDRLGQHPDPFAQDVDVPLGARLAQHVEHGHPVLGHRDLPSCRRFFSPTTRG